MSSGKALFKLATPPKNGDETTSSTNKTSSKALFKLATPPKEDKTTTAQKLTNAGFGANTEKPDLASSLIKQALPTKQYTAPAIKEQTKNFTSREMTPQEIRNDALNEIGGVAKAAPKKIELAALGTLNKGIVEPVARTIVEVGHAISPTTFRKPDKETTKKYEEEALARLSGGKATEGDKKAFDIGQTYGAPLLQQLTPIGKLGPIGGFAASGGLNEYASGGDTKDIAKGTASGAAFGLIGGTGTKYLSKLGTTALNKVGANNVVGRLANETLSSGIAGAGAGVASGQINDFGHTPTLDEILGNAGMNAVFHVAPRVGAISKGNIDYGPTLNERLNSNLDEIGNTPFKGISEVGKTPSALELKQQYINDIKSMPKPNLPYDIPVKSNEVTARTLPNKYSVKNTKLEKANAEYENAINDIQNHYGTNTLRVDEQNNIKNVLGHDLPSIVSKMEKAEGLTSKDIINKAAETSKFKRVADVTSDKTNNLINNITEKPKSLYNNAKLPKESNNINAQNETFKNDSMSSEFSNEITPTVKSSRELPNISKMTQSEFDNHYGLDKSPTLKSAENLVEDVGAKVINKTGLTDIPQITKYYAEKYNLPKNIKVSYTLSKGTNKGNTTLTRGLNGEIVGARININPNQSLEGKIGSLRHEIEHYKDLVEGYSPTENKYKYNPAKDKTARDLYSNASTGHHKNYNWFESDYLRRASVKEALKNGEKVPLEVMNEFPDLKNVKLVSEPVESTIGTKALKNELIKYKEFKNPLETTNKIGESKNPLEPQGKRVESGFSKNVRTDENMDDKIRSVFEKNPLEHNQLENKTTLESAQNRFNKGYDKALNDFRESNSFRADDVPLARMLANEAAKRGDMETANYIVAKITDKLVEAGRFSQAAKIMRKSDPTTIIMTMDRLLSKLNDKGSKLYGKKWNDIKLSDAQKKEIYSLELFDETKVEKLMNRMYKDINDQIPVGLMEKFDAWRRMAMLLNPKTHIRNLIGNAIMMNMRKSSDTLGAAIEKMFLKQELRTKSLGWSKDKNLVDLVEKEWQNSKEALLEHGKYDIESLNLMNKDKKIFDTKWLEKVNQFSKDSLNWGDSIFLGRAYKDALGQFVKARGLKEVTEEAREYATRRALEATYRQSNQLATLINKGKQIPFAGKALDVVLPFSKTPLNIAKTAFDYSPAGLMKTLYDAKTGKTPQQVVETLSKGLTGTGILALGMGLANIGWARSETENNKALEAMNQESGASPNSIVTPLGSYSFDWASPMSIPLAMGISIYNSLSTKTDQQGLNKVVSSVIDSVVSGGDTFINMSMLKNIKDIVGGYGSTTEKMLQIPLSFIEQLVPTLSGQAARGVDDIAHSTYDTNETGKFIRRIKNKIPGLSKGLEPKVDVYGREVRNGPFDAQVENAAYQLISPGNALPKSDDKVTKELVALHKKTGDTDFLPKVSNGKTSYEGTKLIMNPMELTKFQKTMGKASYNSIKELIESPEYYDMSTEDKIKEIRSRTNSALDTAKEELAKARGLIKD